MAFGRVQRAVVAGIVVAVALAGFAAPVAAADEVCSPACIEDPKNGVPEIVIPEPERSVDHVSVMPGDNVMIEMKDSDFVSVMPGDNVQIVLRGVDVVSVMPGDNAGFSK